MANQKKIDLVNGLSNILKDNKNFALVKFDKTKHQTLETLKKSLRKSDAVLKVVKNTLFEKTIAKMSENDKLLKEFQKKFFPLKEPSAILLLKNEWSKGLKAFYEFTQKEKTLAFKSALLDNLTYADIDVEKIAQLPGKDQLIGKIIGSFKTPSNNLVYNMKFNINKLVYILQEKSKKQINNNT